MNIKINEYAKRLMELDNLYLNIYKISGFTVEQLLDMFKAGYEMASPKYGAISQLMPEDIGTEKKEVPTMQVTYNGFTGELVKLERDSYDKPNYSVSIFNEETGATASFSGIALEDVQLHGREVTFGG